MSFSNVRSVPLVISVLAIIVGLSGCTTRYDPYYPRTHRAVYGGQLARAYPCGRPPPVSCRPSHDCCSCCGPEPYPQARSAYYDNSYSIQPYPYPNYRQPTPAYQPYPYPNYRQPTRGYQPYPYPNYRQPTPGYQPYPNRDYRRSGSAYQPYARRGGSVSVYGPYGAESRGAYSGPYGSTRTSRSTRYY